MTTLARIVDGFAVDIVVTPPLLAERFNAEWLARQTFVFVPDGTLHGAKDNGDGTFTNPPSPPVVTPDPEATLTETQKLQIAVQAIAEKLGVDIDAAISAAVQD